MSLTGAQWSQLRLQLDHIAAHFVLSNMYKLIALRATEWQAGRDVWVQLDYYLRRITDAECDVTALLAETYDEAKSAKVVAKLEEAFTAYEELDSYLRGLIEDDSCQEEAGIPVNVIKEVHDLLEEWYDIMVQGVDNLPIPTPGS